MPAEGDAEIAGGPADSEATILAAEEEIQLMPYLRVIGNPTNMGLNDDDLSRGNPQDVGDLPERTQYEFGHNAGMQYTFVASDRSMGR
eukprot:954237-Pyramimonas_sp.AAC.1